MRAEPEDREVILHVTSAEIDPNVQQTRKILPGVGTYDIATDPNIDGVFFGRTPVMVDHLADVNARTDSGNTPLILAVKWGSDAKNEAEDKKLTEVVDFLMGM